MFIIIYRGHDNDLHMVKYGEDDLTKDEMVDFFGKVKQFNTELDATIVAKIQCPNEYEIFEINW